MNRNSIVFILALIGGILGVIVVRLFFLNPLQIMGWNIFWNNLSHLNFDLFKLIFKSATFGKCVFGFIAGCAAGGIVGVIAKR
jgi:hypothetical protein